MNHFLTFGIILGLSAGFSPGPLLTVLFSETIQHGTRAGIKVALAPIITDLPVIVLTCFVLARLSHFQSVLGVISLIGGILICYMGAESIRQKGTTVDLHRGEAQSLRKGMLVNLLNPHPYLFWFSVGAPTLNRAMSTGIAGPLFFIGGFYTMLIGSKIFLAAIIGKSRSFLNSSVYTYIVRILGLVLCGLAFVLFRDGLKLLGIL